MVLANISSKVEERSPASATVQSAVTKNESIRTAAHQSSRHSQDADSSSINLLYTSSVKSEKLEKLENASVTESMMDKTQHENNEENVDQSSPRPKRIIWRDIYAAVVPERKFLSSWRRESNEQPRIVLNSVSGYAEPGQITFLMGSSGAGKTTLLNILTQQQKGLRVYGEVAVNKHVMEAGEMRRLSAYVQQEDLFIGELTVKETLQFNSHLRMPSTCTSKERRMRVNQVTTEMGLEPCLGTKIGSAHEKSISKGEKKRLAFACELLTDPHILFCDEPTSGLDSFMALQVIRALKTLAGEGKTIICSIHQPSSQVYELADRLVLMAAGRVAYQGPANHVGEYFTSISYPCPQFVSVSDHFLTVLSHNPEKEEESDYNKRIEGILDRYSNTSLAKETHQITHEQLSSSRRKMKEPDEKPEYAATWFTQFRWLLWRGIICVLRHPMVLRVRLFQSFLVAILIGVMNFQLLATKETIMNFRGVAYCSLRDMNIMFLFPCIQVFTAELHIAKREYRSSIYRPSAYFMGRNIADSVQYLVFPLVYSTIVYWMAGFALNFEQYVVFWMVTTIMAITSASIGYAGACICGDLTIASTYLPLFTVPMLVFGGLLIDLRSLSSSRYWFMKVFNWMSYLSWYRYAFETNIINIFRYVDDIPGCENADVFNRLENNTIHECLGSNGTMVIDYHGLNENPNQMWLNMLIMIGFIVGWRTIAMTALHFRMRRT